MGHYLICMCNPFQKNSKSSFKGTRKNMTQKKNVMKIS